METTEEDKKKAYKKKYYQEHREILLRKQKKYQAENSDKVKIYKKKYRCENPVYIKIYRKENSEHIKTKQKVYRYKNSEDIKSKMKEYRIKNADRLKIYRQNYKRNRLKTDPSFKMVENLRSRLYQALKSQSAKKDETTLELCGASQEFVWNHLISKFKEGMTRDNNNPKGWHVDHIIPMISFNLSDPEERKKCCHYTNLQPLWWWENLEKSDKLIFSQSSQDIQC